MKKPERCTGTLQRWLSIFIFWVKITLFGPQKKVSKRYFNYKHISLGKQKLSVINKAA
jgi:hypothetical protein